jgi:hypothetical protein
MSGDSSFFFHRLRLPILIVCAALALWGAYAVPQSAPVALAAAASGGFLAAYARLRHFSLALAASVAPLPGILWFGSSAYALCIALAILMTADYGDALLKEENPHPALVRVMPALAAALIFAGLWSLFARVDLPGLLAAAAATILCLPPLLLSVDFTEEAVVRSNRQREKLLRLFTLVGHIPEPRWSISLSGVGVVLAVLGCFEITAKPPVFDWLSAPVAAALLFAFTRDIHAVLAGLAACALLLLFTGGLGGALLLFLLFAVTLERNSGGFRAQGENAAMAARRAIEERGSAILFAGLAAMIAAAARGGGLAALHAGCGLIAAIILFPAFWGALQRIFPARRSIEEIYRAGSSVS